MSRVIPRTTTAALILVALAVAPVAAQFREHLPPAACQADDDRIAVLLLGSYHMSNPGQDQFNLTADDVRTPRRQQELERLATHLARFNPSKVAIEAAYGDSGIQAAYQAYVTGGRELRANEVDQIGFRLAKRMGHDAIYPIDAQMMLDDAALGPVIAGNPAYQAKMGELQRIGGGIMAEMAQWLPDGTVSDMLRRMNSPEVLEQGHWPYLWVLAPMVEGENYAGADMVGTWYTRNLRIFANLNRITGPGDRVLVVYGQGHVPILQQFVESSPDFCRVDPLPYLQGEGE